MTSTVYIIPELFFCEVVRQARFICTTNLSKGDASHMSREQSISRFPPADPADGISVYSGLSHNVHVTSLLDVALIVV